MNIGTGTLALPSPSQTALTEGSHIDTYRKLKLRIATLGNIGMQARPGRPGPPRDDARRRLPLQVGPGSPASHGPEWERARMPVARPRPDGPRRRAGRLGPGPRPGRQAQPIGNLRLFPGPPATRQRPLQVAAAALPGPGRRVL